MNRLALKVKPPLVTILSVGLMLLLDHFSLKSMFNIGFDLFRLTIAVTSACTGCIIAVLAVGLFFKFKTTIHPDLKHNTNYLVTSGIYQISRNPMYLGMLLNLVAVSLWINNWLAVLVCFGFIFYINQFQIKPEECFLQNKFGKNYQVYCQKVRRWF